jgi:hypothetical protein
MEYFPGHALNRPTRSSEIIVATEANHLRLHTGYHPITFEVADALSV